MSEHIRESEGAPKIASATLRASGVLWYAIAAIGQLAFIVFIIAYFGMRTATGDFAGWNDKPLIHGHIEGDSLGNAGFAIHVLFAAVITFSGLVQLLPWVRRVAPKAHHISGRVFAVLAYVLAIGGLALIWLRGTRLSVEAALATSLNAVLILVFIPIAVRLAMLRRIEEHRRWALRSFMAVSGVWFFRVGLMAWVIINQGPVGMNRTLSGPADIAISFGSFLIPLAVLEMYFAAQRSGDDLAKFAMAFVVLVASAVTAIGVFGAITILWFPYV